VGRLTPRLYGKVKKAEAVAKKCYEQACAEADAAEETADKCRQKHAHAEAEYEKAIAEVIQLDDTNAVNDTPRLRFQAI
jgi:hypothetical protein